MLNVNFLIFEPHYYNQSVLSFLDIDGVVRETPKAICYRMKNSDDSLWFPKAALKEKDGALWVARWFRFDERAVDVFAKHVYNL